LSSTLCKPLRNLDETGSRWSPLDPWPVAKVWRRIIERLMEMVGEGATADDVSQLLAKDRTAMLRDLMQGTSIRVPSESAA